MPTFQPLGLVFGDIFTAARAATFETQYKLAKERTRPLGGIPDVGESSTSYVDLPGAIVVETIDALTAKLHVMGFVSGGTASLRLYDITAAAAVASSEITWTSTTATLQKTPNIELPAAHQFKAQIKISTGTHYAVSYGCHLVSQ